MPRIDDIGVAKVALSKSPVFWDGKQCVLDLKEANYNWRQMEWRAFYFELLCQRALLGTFSIPGDRYGNARTACFDARRTIDWDFKAKAIKSDDHRAILNDVAGMDLSIKTHKAHGLIIALCDVEYNDENRSFQKWHQELKGGKSKYEMDREKRTSISRYRKTQATLKEILFLLITSRTVSLLDIYQQGRNSNGNPRPPKYMLDFDKTSRLIVDRIEF